MEEERIVSLDIIRKSKGILGNIYVGKVKHILKNIQSAFVEIGDGQVCYLSLLEAKNPIFTTNKKEGNIQCGDEILVQVSREAMKTKEPVVTTNISLTGKYTVLTTGKKYLGISGKMSPKEKEKWKEKLSSFFYEFPFGIIIRTNAKNVSFPIVEEELKKGKKELEQLLSIAKHRTCFSLIKESPKQYLTQVRDLYDQHLEGIITDEPKVYEEINAYLSSYEPENLHKLTFYEDKLLPLSKLYSFETIVKEALSKKIWLKSGGYLVIEQTEALVVIDVNTGKYIGNKNMQDTFLKINREAAKEIARQLRLRNLSGIILIDFIDMEEKEYREILLRELGSHFSKDPIQTTLVDMTVLHLVEVTRKRIRKPLWEQIREGERERE